MRKLFHRKTPEEEAREWTRQLRSEARKVDLQITKIRREEQKVKVSMKQAAKQGDQGAVRILAKELVRSRKAVSRLYTAKAQMNSVSMQLQNQVSQIKLAGHMQKSGEIMAEMNALVNVKEVSQSMMALSKEMAKAGLVDEMMNDAIDDALDQDISDGELEDEMNKVIEEVTQNQMAGARVGTGALPQRQQQQQQVQEEEEEDPEADEIAKKLAALRDGTV